MSNLLKKLIISLLTSLVVLFSFVPSLQVVKAQNPVTQQSQDVYNLWNHTWYSEQDPFAWYKKVYDTNTSPDSEIFGERYTAAQVQWVMYGVFSALWNLIPGNPQLTICAMSGDISSCAGVLQKYINILNPLNVTGSTGNSKAIGLFSVIGQSPISGVYYFKNLINKFTIVTPVEAQGFGYNVAGNSVIEIWRIFRNIAYGLTVPVVLILAFMIMFRVKISPQVVISVQSAIPKLIITLILITFSYAIAGLAVDLMYVVIGLIAAALAGGHLSSTSATDLFGALTTYYNGFFLLYLYWIYLVGAAITTIFSGLGLGILVFLFAIILIVAVLWWSLKIIWMLIKTFVSIIITIAVGPLEILFGAVTGAVGFGSWFKRLISFLAVYPVVGLMFFFSFFFLMQGADPNTIGALANTSHMPFSPVANVITGNEWVPPFSFATSSGYRLVWILVSIFIFSQITKAAEVIQSFFSGKPFEYGSAIGEAVGMAGKGVGVAGAMADRESIPGRVLPRLSDLIQGLAGRH